MSEVKIIGPNVPNMPWQDRPADKKDKSEIPVWRYSENPCFKGRGDTFLPYSHRQ